MDVQVEVIDCSFSTPAEGVDVTLLREVDAGWRQEATVRTDETGCAAVPQVTGRGRYRLALDVDKYFSALGVAPFQSRVDVTFRVFSASEKVAFLSMITPSWSSVCRLVTGDRSHRGTTSAR